MARKAAKPQHVEPEDASQEMPEEEPARHAEPAAESISKAEGVRRALADGLEDLDEIESFLKTRYGIEMPRQQISAYKSQAKAKAGKAADAPAAKRGRKPAAVDGYLAPPEKPKPVGQETDLLAALEAMKPLVAALGAEKAHRIIDLLG